MRNDYSYFENDARCRSRSVIIIIKKSLNEQFEVIEHWNNVKYYDIVKNCDSLLWFSIVIVLINWLSALNDVNFVYIKR